MEITGGSSASSRTSHNMMRIFLLTLLLLMFLGTHSQVTLQRQVVGSFALNGTVGNMHFSTVAGQPEHRTLSSTSFFLTEGFEQPLHHKEGSVQFELTLDDCTGIVEAEITGFSGCLYENNVSILWDDEDGTEFYTLTNDTTSLEIYAYPGCVVDTLIVLSEALITTLPCDNGFYQLITPNNDGANDGWIIDQIDQPEFAGAMVRIYNRWGMVVWMSDQYDNHNVLWTGRSNEGTELPDGTYFYTVETTARAYTGFVELQR